ncbi:hypothetical protein PMAYCL1PPCAC_00178, partial [Pristionchus mayeri]
LIHAPCLCKESSRKRAVTLPSEFRVIDLNFSLLKPHSFAVTHNPSLPTSTMLRACFLLSLLAVTSAMDFSKSVVLTSADVQVGQPMQLTNLKPDTAYRVYATYASGNSADYATNVRIYDGTGASYTVAGLSQAKPGSSYILDNIRILRAPIFVHDTNTGSAAPTPFTIYIVDESVPSFPVVDARQAFGQVDSDNGFRAAGLTVLSAEQYFTMANFDIGNIASMFISSVGYDESNSAYQVMRMDSAWEAKLSFLSMYGPIATLFNEKYGINARFQFQFTRNIKYDFTLSPGASFAFVSPGYLSNSLSYNIPYPLIGDALDRSYTFGANTFIQAAYSANDFQNGENMHLQFTDAGNTVADVNLQQNGNNRQLQWANRISMKVENPNGNHSPRFLVQVTSGSSLAFSLLGVLLVSLFSKLY